MKQLFLKSNLLHIRTNEGEFEVSNPEIVGKFGIRILSESFILRYPLFTKDGYILLEGNDEAEWPYGVELIVSTEGVSTKAVARLLPKEEKKEPFVKALDDIQDVKNLSVDNSAHSFTESAYTTVSSNTHTCGKFEIRLGDPVIVTDETGTYKSWIGGVNDHPESAYKEFEEAAIKQGHVIESSEPQENIFDLPKDVVFDLQRIALADDEMSAGFGAGVEYRLIARSILNKHRKPVAAPSESQEEMWNEVNEHINAQIGDYISLEAVKLSFILTRKPE